MPLPLILALALAGAQAEPEADEPPPPPIVTLRKQVVEAIRNCGKSGGDEIVVCSKDRGIAEAYRLPKLDPRFADVDHGLHRGEALDAGGATTCDRVGAAAAIGCAKRDYDAWGDWKRKVVAAKRAAEGGR